MAHHIAKYRSAGEVILMGDMNARTGGLDDFCNKSDLSQWEGMESAGVHVPSGLIHDQSHIARMFSHRANKDTVSDSNGRLLADICRDHGLIILNGRISGDQEGMHTYFQHGKLSGSKSVIDYFVSTPSLCFGSIGEIKGASCMSVGSIKDNPKRPDGGNFDHVPIMLTVDRSYNLSKKKEGHNDKGENRQGSRVFKWRPECAGQYVGIITGDPQVISLLEGMHILEDVEDADLCFCSAIEDAVHLLHGQTGGVVGKSTALGDRSTSGGPCNAWFDDVCRQARQRFTEIEHRLGEAAEDTKAAYKSYRCVTRAARRRWEKARDDATLRDVHQHPKRFWSKYGQSVKKVSTIGVEEWTAYFEDLFKSHGQAGQENDMSGVDDMDMHARLFPQPDTGAIGRAAWLNSDFCVEEVVETLGRADNGKAPGADGMPIEFLKHAVKEVGVGEARRKVNVLAVHIVHLFNLVLKHGYPKSWAVGTLVPVPKSKGDKGNKDDYRGIVVGKSLAKLYSMIMLQRLDRWAEHGGLRAKGQAGFRHGRGTPDNAFILNHIVEKYRVNRKPVYAVFIDFRKAYDCVDRDLLWKSLSSLGLHGHFLESLRQMYADVRIRVRANGQLGEDFSSDTGVKQGDALSPLLFGLFIDRIEGFINGLDTEVGVWLKDMLLRVLLYADDVVLLAESLQGLQQLLHTV
jgi:sorting nexin-29